MQFFLPKFLGQLHREPPQTEAPKSIFLTADARVLVVFDISR